MSLTVRRGFKRRGGLLHRVTKPREVWCPRDAGQGKATNTRDAQTWQSNHGPASGAPTRSKQALGCPAKELPLLTVIYVVTHLEKG